MDTVEKNRLYKRARDLRVQIQGAMCTRDECWHPDKMDVQKMVHSEFKMHPKMSEYTEIMKKIGADPKDCSTEALRKGK